MQDNELLPGGKNVLPRRARLGGLDRRGRDRPLNPLKNFV